MVKLLRTQSRKRRNLPCWKKTQKEKPFSTSETYCIVLFIESNQTYLHKYSLNSLLLRWSNPLRINLAAIFFLRAGFLVTKIMSALHTRHRELSQIKMMVSGSITPEAVTQSRNRIQAPRLRTRRQKGRFPQPNIKEVEYYFVFWQRCQPKLKVPALHLSNIETVWTVGMVRKFSVLCQTTLMSRDITLDLAARHGDGWRSFFYAELASHQVFTTSWVMNSARGFRIMGWKLSCSCIWPEYFLWATTQLLPCFTLSPCYVTSPLCLGHCWLMAGLENIGE